MTDSDLAHLLPNDVLNKGSDAWNSWLRNQSGRKNFGSIVISNRDPNFNSSLLKDYEFINCDIDVLSIQLLHVEGCLIKECRIRRFELINVDVSTSTVQDCEIENLYLEQTTITDSAIRCTEFQKIETKKARFIETELQEIETKTLSAKAWLKIQDSCLGLRIKGYSELNHVEMTDSTMSLNSDRGPIQLADFKSERTNLENSRFTFQTSSVNYNGGFIRDSHITLVKGTKGDMIGTMVSRSTLRGIDLGMFRLNDSSIVESALPELKLPSGMHSRKPFCELVLPTVPKWVPVHPIRDIQGIGESERIRLAELQSRRGIWRNIKRGGFIGLLFVIWAACTGFGRSMFRLGLTSLIVLILGSGLMLVPVFKVTETNLCPAADNTTAVCMQTEIGHLSAPEAILSTLSLTFSLPPIGEPIDLLGWSIVVIVGIAGVFVLALILSIMVYWLLRVSSEGPG